MISKVLVSQVRCTVLSCLMKHGEVIRPSIIWCDQRTEKECEEMTEKVGAEKSYRDHSQPCH